MTRNLVWQLSASQPLFGLPKMIHLTTRQAAYRSAAGHPCRPGAAGLSSSRRSENSPCHSAVVLGTLSRGSVEALRSLRRLSALLRILSSCFWSHVAPRLKDARELCCPASRIELPWYCHHVRCDGDVRLNSEGNKDGDRDKRCAASDYTDDARDEEDDSKDDEFRSGHDSCYQGCSASPNRMLLNLKDKEVVDCV